MKEEICSIHRFLEMGAWPTTRQGHSGELQDWSEDKGHEEKTGTRGFTVVFMERNGPGRERRLSWFRIDWFKYQWASGYRACP